MSKYALISVFNKKGIEVLAKNLVEIGYKIISTGGTYKYLTESISKKNMIQVSDLTKYPEILGGRVKTLHPMIHGGILAKRDLQKEEMGLLGLPDINVVAVNLYPFEETVKKTQDESIILENIDIGGHTLIRAAAKNYKDVTIIVDPCDYHVDLENIDIEKRYDLMRKAFNHATIYDLAINKHFVKQEYRLLTRKYNFKYGTNPHQKKSSLLLPSSQTYSSNSSPIKLLNGTCGYINMKDALYAWQLVRDVDKVLGVCACASYKHNSPAGAALGLPLSDTLKRAYMVKGDFTEQECAFIRARGADPLSSFGDFLSINRVVSKELALRIKTEVSDGIIAPGYDDEAYEILSKKKGGNYVIIEMDPNFDGKKADEEFLEMFGIVISQEPDREVVTYDDLKDENIVTDTPGEVSKEKRRDLILASIALKYTQSNSIAIAYDGQLIGVGSGQQNRVDCVKIAVRKAKTWFLRQHQSFEDIWNTKGLKRQEKVNKIYEDIDGILWLNSPIHMDYLNQFNDLSLSSDAFFPFSDNIDVAKMGNVKYLVQPGGSTRDKEVIERCNKYGMIMFTTGKRLFTH